MHGRSDSLVDGSSQLTLSPIQEKSGAHTMLEMSGQYMDGFPRYQNDLSEKNRGAYSNSVRPTGVHMSLYICFIISSHWLRLPFRFRLVVKVLSLLNMTMTVEKTVVADSVE
ncbi:hypothetical protein RRG08_030886 [Elysia crispata]|uniref:Uncharacterized protein n=1 Tax=Elysia crispata TaxID=231223 RepID=A0AAE1CLV2_9GAST|nr:hypothetical protein RRG08_030886 [Elysia crispata]